MPAILHYCGLDVHKRVVEACFLDGDGKITKRLRFELTAAALEAFARKELTPRDHVALEATTNCWAVASILRPFVAGVLVSNPLATKAIAAAKVKTDKVDAHVLAQLLRIGFLPGVWQPDEDTRQMRELTGRRTALTHQSTALRNRIHSVLAMRLIVPPMDSLFSARGMEWLKAADIDPQARMLIDSDLRMLAAVQAEMAVLDQELATRGYASDPVKLLMTLPGCDLAVASAVVAAWGDVSRFPDGDRAASYLGLTPSTRQSASHCYHGPITKQGRTQARWMLVQAAQHLDRHPGPLGCFFRRLMRKKTRNVAVVATARKLAAIAWQMLTTNEPYRYAIPRSTETKLARLRVRATAERRKGGTPKGRKSQARLPGGSRAVRSLGEVCRAENLPAPKPLAPGEQRIVRENQCENFVAEINQPHIVPRRKAQPAAQPTAQPTGPASQTPQRVARKPLAPRGQDPAEASSRAFRRPRAGDQGCSLPPPGPQARGKREGQQGRTDNHDSPKP